MEKGKFRKLIYAHFRKEGRVFPWRTTRDPYRIFVSEVMLQQTQAPRVVEKYREFLRAFPTLPLLARARPRKLLATWQGLGYNRRALNLQRAAARILKEHGGKIPRDLSALDALPGIGPYTARAILAFAYNEPLAFIETNIRSVFIHFFFTKSKKKISDADILPLVEAMLDRKHPREWYFALMDYGVLLKKRENASRRSAHYKKQSPFRGSHRERRGAILKLVLLKKSVPRQELMSTFKNKETSRALDELEREGFITVHRDVVRLP